MQFTKRIGLYILIILLFTSIYQDVTNHAPEQPLTESATPVEKNMTRIKLQVQTGDTVLSIVEELNENNQRFHMDIPQIIHDFKKINSNIDPHHLQPDHHYFFPLYHDNIK